MIDGSGADGRDPQPLATVLGTDGFGLSGTREELRDHFEVSAGHIALAVASELESQRAIPPGAAKAARLAVQTDGQPG